MAKISLICTVRDEALTLAPLLDSILAQTRLPDEIVINDCGSKDATASVVQSYMAREPRLKLVAGGFNIASGRNNAIAATTNDLIASTDAGLVLDPHWLEQIIAPLEAETADIVAGFFQPAPESLFELTLAATNYRHLSEIEPTHFLPFGKSLAFRKEVWATVGGFPEWLDHCEDIVFAQAAARAGYRRTFAPKALLYFRPRADLQAFARQYFYYARGDGRAALFPLRHSIRYGTYGALLGLLLLAQRHRASRWLLALFVPLGGVAYTYRPYWRLGPQIAARSLRDQAFALALVPLIRLVGDLAKMLGYPVGWAQRLRTRLFQ